MKTEDILSFQRGEGGFYFGSMEELKVDPWQGIEFNDGEKLDGLSPTQHYYRAMLDSGIGWHVWDGYDGKSAEKNPFEEFERIYGRKPFTVMLGKKYQGPEVPDGVEIKAGSAAEYVADYAIYVR